jgi:serine/threonine-protein kinase TNNI3K
MVLEAMSGDTLSYHIAHKRSPTTHVFSELRYLRIGKEFAAALAYIHHNIHPGFCIIHRDLKPDNIGFTTDGVLKLMDFGLSVCVPRSGALDEKYDLTGCTGSLRYMAPEVALNEKYNEKVVLLLLTSSISRRLSIRWTFTASLSSCTR